MASLLNRTLHVDMGADVLGLLRTLSPLPDQGIIAGQAVTSALLKLYGDPDRQGTFNDIDVFVENSVKNNPLHMSFQLRHFMQKQGGIKTG